MSPYLFVTLAAFGIVAGLIWIRMYDQAFGEEEEPTANKTNQYYLPIALFGVIMVLLLGFASRFFNPSVKDSVWREYISLQQDLEDEIEQWSTYDYHSMDSIIRDKKKMLKQVQLSMKMINGKSMIDDDFSEARQDLREFQSRRHQHAQYLVSLVRVNANESETKMIYLEEVVDDLEVKVDNLEVTLLEEEQRSQQLAVLEDQLREEQANSEDLRAELRKEKEEKMSLIKMFAAEQTKNERLMAEISRLNLKLLDGGRMEQQLVSMQQEKAALEREVLQLRQRLTEAENRPRELVLALPNEKESELPVILPIEQTTPLASLSVHQPDPVIIYKEVPTISEDEMARLDQAQDRINALEDSLIIYQSKLKKAKKRPDYEPFQAITISHSERMSQLEQELYTSVIKIESLKEKLRQTVVKPYFVFKDEKDGAVEINLTKRGMGLTYLKYFFSKGRFAFSPKKPEVFVEFNVDPTLFDQKSIKLNLVIIDNESKHKVAEEAVFVNKEEVQVKKLLNGQFKEGRSYTVQLNYGSEQLVRNGGYVFSMKKRA